MTLPKNLVTGATGRTGLPQWVRNYSRPAIWCGGRTHAQRRSGGVVLRSPWPKSPTPGQHFAGVPWQPIRALHAAQCSRDAFGADEAAR